MSKEERLVESLLLKVRRQQIDKGIERKHIKMHNNKIYIRNKLHGQVIDSGSAFCVHPPVPNW